MSIQNIQDMLKTLAQVNPAGFNRLSAQVDAQLLEAGESLTIKQGIFVKANFMKIQDFIRTDAGQEALQKFVKEWMAHTQNPLLNL